MPERKKAAPEAAAGVGKICLGVGDISYFYCFEIPGFEPGFFWGGNFKALPSWLGSGRLDVLGLK